jgi:hypothetical protein
MKVAVLQLEQALPDHAKQVKSVVAESAMLRICVAA